MDIEDIKIAIECIHASDREGDYEVSGCRESRLMQDFIEAIATNTYEGSPAEAAALITKQLDNKYPRWHDALRDSGASYGLPRGQASLR